MHDPRKYFQSCCRGFGGKQIYEILLFGLKDLLPWANERNLKILLMLHIEFIIVFLYRLLWPFPLTKYPDLSHFLV